LHIEDDQSVQIPEYKIDFLPPPSLTFDIYNINNYSYLEADNIWLRDLHIQYSDIFSHDDWNPGKHHGSSVNFSLKTDAPICHQKYSRINPAIAVEAQNIIDMLLVRNLISISKSPWSSQVLFVPKKPAENQQRDADKMIPGERQLIKPKLRMVIDFRYINSKLKILNTHWVLPTIQDVLGKLHSAQYATTIDICSGFWHFSLSKK